MAGCIAFRPQCEWRSAADLAFRPFGAGAAIRGVRQAETAAHIDYWLSSPGLQPTELKIIARGKSNK